MAKQTITRRQKDTSTRLLREKKQAYSGKLKAAKKRATSHFLYS